VSAKYRFLFIRPFQLAADSVYRTRPPDFSELGLDALLADVRWELDPGPAAPYGDWPVGNREEFELVAAARLPIVRRAAESGEWDALILLGGGDPGLSASREIGRRYGIPVTSCAASQMHVACMLGNTFSIVDLADSHSMHVYDLVVQNHMTSRCASIRLIDYPLGRPPFTDERSLAAEKEKALRGEPSRGVDDAVDAASAAIEEDGAEVIVFGCSGTYWLRPFVEAGLRERGWDVPVLEGYSTAIAQAKLMVDLGVDASGAMFPADRPKRLRLRKTFG
jgi:allantoin racemase